MKKTIISLVVIVLVLCVFLYKTLNDAGQFKKLEPHSDMECTVVEGVMSSEDLTIDQETGLAFIGSGMKGLILGEGKVHKGAVFSYDLNDENPRLVNATEDFTGEFYPHGVGLYTDDSGGISLFVVNNKPDSDSVEIFDYDGVKLVHRRSVSGHLMHNPNDVMPSGRNSFYVSNDHGYRSLLGQTIEDFLQLPKSYILYFDGEEFSVVADGLNYANGIDIGPDGKTVYVSETIGHRVNVYDRDIETGSLTFRTSIETGTGLDNIEIDGRGDLWIGAHPKLLTFVKHAGNQSLPSPSQVLRIHPEGDGGYKVDEVYLEEGNILPGSSVAAAYKNRVLVGGVFARRFLDCRR